MGISITKSAFAGVLASAAAASIIIGCSDGSSSDEPMLGIQMEEAYLTEKVTQIGGATTSTTRFTDAGKNEWALYNMADRLAVTPIQATAGAVHEIRLDNFIQDILVVKYNGRDYALAALGKSGIAVVDITSPAAMSVLYTVPVNFYQDGIIFAEGGVIWSPMWLLTVTV